MLEANHARNSNLIWDWSLSFTDTYKNQPDQKIISFRTPNDAKDGYYIRLGNENSPEIRNAGRIFSNLDEKIYNAGVNLKIGRAHV